MTAPGRPPTPFRWASPSLGPPDQTISTRRPPRYVLAALVGAAAGALVFACFASLGAVVYVRSDRTIERDEAGIARLVGVVSLAAGVAGGLLWATRRGRRVPPAP